MGTPNLAVIFRKYWMVALLISLISMLIALIASFVLSPVYEAKVRILVLPKEETIATGIMANPKQPFAQTAGKVAINPEIIEKTAIKLRLDQEETKVGFFRKVLKTLRTGLGNFYTFLKYGYIKKASPLDGATSALESRIQPKVIEETSIVELAAHWDNPQLAAMIANEVAREFVKYARQKNEQETKGILSEIKERVKEREEELKEANQGVLKFRKENNLQGIEGNPIGLSPQDEAKLISLEKQAASAENNFLYWQDLYQNTESKLVTKQEQIRILGPAKAPLYPVKPIKLLYAGVGFLVGALLSLALAFLLEITNKFIYTADDVRNILEAPTLSNPNLK